MSDVFIDEFETNGQWKENHSHEQQDKIDAERYRFLRSLHWSDEKVIVARAGALEVGTQTYSEERLDEIVDKLRSAHDGKDGL